MQQWRPITFISQVIHGKALQLSTYENELMALVLAVKKIEILFIGTKVQDTNSLAKFKISIGTEGWNATSAKVDHKAIRL